ncbi:MULTISPECIES: hypothetical protein [unclassified Streptomyces]|uniref:hypothetical protein n=1 Tax=unclassified Streptomyces TaxID=2593676 RepID=UPI001660A2D4|nr:MULTISPECIES: hypothetical protein [unclassified Streptomyces]MBD0707400.1 hypothetical protein [Streptomyces sp. CBMA291]MBD0715148.1 hypothetical protein [Streptomyces sp. CBMA370]
MALTPPRTWVVGEVVAAAQLNTEIRDQWLDMLAAWTAYTPAWTAVTTNPNLGNGTLTGRYKKTGRLVHVQIDLTMGSTTTYGTGAWSLTLPVTAAAAAGSRIGSAQALGGASRYQGQIVISPGAGGTAAFFPASATVSNLSSVAGGVPFAWAAGNELRITGTYEAAN